MDLTADTPIPPPHPNHREVRHREGGATLKVITIARDEPGEPTVVISNDGASAYADIYPHTNGYQMKRVHLELARHGFELMDGDECPPEVTGNGVGIRMWAARIDGGSE